MSKRVRKSIFYGLLTLVAALLIGLYVSESLRSVTMLCYLIDGATATG
jgi:hypothetical protein